MPPKYEFSAPVGEWLAGPFASRFRDEVLHPTSAVSTLLDQELLNRMFTEHMEGRADHWHPLWAAWMLERWHAVAAERTPAAATASSSVPRHGTTA